MTANILFTGIATAVTIEAGHGFERTDFQRLTEHVAGWSRSPASVVSVVSEHEVVLNRGARGAGVYDSDGKP
jgi:hypothetical protein